MQLLRALLALATCVNSAGATARLRPSAPSDAEATLHARLAELEAENGALRAQLATCGQHGGSPHADISAPAKVGLASTHASLAAGGSKTNASAFSSWLPAYEMPSPKQGQAFVPELNMLPLDAGMAPPSKAVHVTIPGANQWGTPMAQSTVEVDNGKVLTYDDVVYGYNRIWQDLGLWRMQRWKGMRFFQDPMDALIIQQLLWKEQPDLVIEIGTHGGGSAVYYSQIMRDYNPQSLLLTMDPDPSHIEQTPLFHQSPNIKFIQGYSQAPEMLQQVEEACKGRKKVMVVHDAEHTYGPVLRDLGLYDRFVTVGSYFVVQDTSLDRTAPQGGGALAAVGSWVQAGGKGFGRYGIDKAWEYLFFSTNHNGFLKKVAA